VFEFPPFLGFVGVPLSFFLFFFFLFFFFFSVLMSFLYTFYMLRGPFMLFIKFSDYLSKSKYNGALGYITNFAEWTSTLETSKKAMVNKQNGTEGFGSSIGSSF